jgi:hypothetical protein
MRKALLFVIVFAMVVTGLWLFVAGVHLRPDPKARPKQWLI